MKMILLDATELEGLLARTIRSELAGILQRTEPVKQKETEDLLTVTDLCKKFKVSRQTVSSWTRQGKLQKHCLGGKVFYKASQVETALRKV